MRIPTSRAASMKAATGSGIASMRGDTGSRISKKQESTSDARGDGFRAGRHGQLVKEQLNVCLHGVFRDPEARCDLFIRQAVSEEGQDFALAVGEDCPDDGVTARRLSPQPGVFARVRDKDDIDGRWHVGIRCTDSDDLELRARSKRRGK